MQCYGQIIYISYKLLEGKACRVGLLSLLKKHVPHDNKKRDTFKLGFSSNKEKNLIKSILCDVNNHHNNVLSITHANICRKHFKIYVLTVNGNSIGRHPLTFHWLSQSIAKKKKWRPIYLWISISPCKVLHTCMDFMGWMALAGHSWSHSQSPALSSSVWLLHQLTDEWSDHVHGCFSLTQYHTDTICSAMNYESMFVYVLGGICPSRNHQSCSQQSTMID